MGHPSPNDVRSYRRRVCHRVVHGSTVITSPSVGRSSPVQRDGGAGVSGTGVSGTGAAPLRRGTLTTEVPVEGERFDVLAELPVARDGGGPAGARVARVVVEHIVSSATPDPGTYDQEQDEWVVVLAGAAVLEVAGEDVALATGDWVLLPAHTVHRVVRTEPGTRWLAVHVHPTPHVL